MFTIKRSCVRLKASPSTKEDAIRLAGSLLVDAGFIDSAYIESMLQREVSANTFIGGGIAIPHGLPKNRDSIRKTGVSIVQIPQGVVWQDGQKVYTVLGIAAMSDEHIEVLRHLTHLLDDNGALEKLRTSGSEDQIIEIITGLRDDDASAPEDLSTYPCSGDCTITGSIGFHARPATVFVEEAKRFSSDVLVRFGNRFAQGKSLASLLKLGAGGGARLTIFTRGDDADRALSALVSAVESGLGEGEEEETISLSHNWSPSKAEITISGLSASGGIALGHVRFHSRAEIAITREGKGAAAELESFKAACAGAIAELERLYETVKTRSGISKAVIFKAHIEFLKDPDLIDRTKAGIQQGNSAAWSWQQVYEQNASALAALSDVTLSARSADIRDIGRRVLSFLAGTVKIEESSDTAPYILVADDLSPSDTAQLDPALVLGFCTSAGAPTSHTAITARSLGIPAVVGCGQSIFSVKESSMAVLDGTNGRLNIGLSEADLKTAEAARESLSKL
jgi:multiphosphoryl transfer protein